MRLRICSFLASLARRLCQVMGSVRVSTSIASSASISASPVIVQPSVPGSRHSPGQPLRGRRASSGRWSRRAVRRPRGRCTPLGGRGSLRTLKTAPVLSSEMVSCRAVRGSGRRRLLTFIGHDRSPGHLPGAGADHALWGQTLLTLQSDTHVTAGQTVDPVSPRPSKHDTPSGLATASRRYHRPPLPVDRLAHARGASDQPRPALHLSGTTTRPPVHPTEITVDLPAQGGQAEAVVAHDCGVADFAVHALLGVALAARLDRVDPGTAGVLATRLAEVSCP
jgi:hypothetical protein